MKTAKEEFKKARDAAQMAFGVVPDITDKILATKLLVTSTFYEFQDNFDTAKALCLKYTERMNNLPEVLKACEMIFTPQKSFSEKLLTMSGKNKREEILQGIAEINNSIRVYLKQFFEYDLSPPLKISFGNCNINPITDMCLYRKMSIVSEIERATSHFTSVAMQGQFLFAALGNTTELSSTNSILALDITKETVTHLLSHTKMVLTICVNEKYLYSGSADKTIIVWDLKNLVPVKTLSGHEGSVRSICLIGKYLLSGSVDGKIRIWSEQADFECKKVLIIGKPVMKIEGGNDKYFFCMCGVSTIQIWDFQKFVVLQELNVACYGSMTVPNNVSTDLIAQNGALFVPVKSQNEEAIQCWNLGSLSLNGCVLDTGHNIGKFNKSHYLFCGKSTVKEVNVNSQRTVLEREIRMLNQKCTTIQKMWTYDSSLYMLCKTDSNRYYIVKY